MGRKPEPLLKRIARHVGETEESLTEILTTADESKHLPWSGALAPKVRTTRTIRPPQGLPYTVNVSPQPVMLHEGRQQQAVRLLFCHHHHIESMAPEVRLLSICKLPLCISPFHRKMVATYSRRWNQFAPLPDLNVSEATQLVEYLTENEETFRNNRDLLSHYPPEVVEQAYRRLKW
jgi:hypothetical protein